MEFGRKRSLELDKVKSDSKRMASHAKHWFSTVVALFLALIVRTEFGWAISQPSEHIEIQRLSFVSARACFVSCACVLLVYVGMYVCIVFDVLLCLCVFGVR